MNDTKTQETTQVEEKTISKIIDSKITEMFFKIPPYQRLYAWERVQIETLLEDIYTQFKEDSKKQYFIGNIVISKPKDEQKHNELIDGQQRLTTLWLIGFYLFYKFYKRCKKWEEFLFSGGKPRIAMPLRKDEESKLKSLYQAIQANKANKDFQTLIIEQWKDTPSPIKEGLQIIGYWFEQFEQSEKGKKLDLGKFENYIYDKVAFVIVTLVSSTDLNRFFVRMNNRGKQLEKHEILKARLLNSIGEEAEREKYGTIWDLCSEMDKYIFQSANDRNRLLNQAGEENNDDQVKVKSIIDFPTLLLHTAQLCLWENKNQKTISFQKNKLLEIIEIEDENIVIAKDQTSIKAKNFILTLLKYRILFDYFVIKEMKDEKLGKRYLYDIKKLENNYTLSVSSANEDLAMVQNYLRVARTGNFQSYDSWLTKFLYFLSQNQKICPTQAISNNNQIINDNGEQIIINDDKQIIINIKHTLDLISELEKIDTESLPNKKFEEQNLDNGTGTPHYWFYRLDYYLWKYSSQLEQREFGKDNKKFGKFKEVIQNFRFRNLNSVEHIQPQSKQGEWDIDTFGNLALISISFNSSLNNKEVNEKMAMIDTQIKDNNLQSLKYYFAKLAYEKDNEEWTCDKAQEQGKVMKKILRLSLAEENQQENIGNQIEKLLENS